MSRPDLSSIIDKNGTWKTKEPYRGVVPPVFLRTTESFLNEQSRRSTYLNDKPASKAVETKLKLKSNFRLKPDERPHELNSFYDTYTKLD